MRTHTLKIPSLLAVAAVILALTFLPLFSGAALAQDVPAVDTPTSEPPTVTPTNTPTFTPTWTPTSTSTATATNTQEPPPIDPAPTPVPIPEPVTTILFGTGLAALSAAVAARRKKG